MPRMPGILVIGNAIPERVRRAESGAEGLRLGGVGAITAEALAGSPAGGSDGAGGGVGEAGGVGGGDGVGEAGAGGVGDGVGREDGGAVAVTLLAVVSDDEAGLMAQELLRQQEGYAVRTAPALGTAGYSRAVTIQGEAQETEAVYPTITWGEIGAAATEELASARYDWVAADCNLNGEALFELARRVPAGRLVINGTADDRCERILATIPYFKGAVTLNRSEAAVLLRRTSILTRGAGKLNIVRDDAVALAQRLNARRLLLTLDAEGWLLAAGGAAFHHRAAAAPADSDFIGAGDAATAGLIRALATGAEVAPAIAGAIVRRLEGNRMAGVVR